MSKKKMIGRYLGTTVLSGAALAMAAPAFAQDDQIVVTGTRVVNPNLSSSSPITSVDAEEFSLTGTTRVEDLLNTYPQLAPSFDAFTVNPTTGFATADLRGLGTNRTLILVNGHRLQPGGIRSQASDLNQIPTALVKRVEVLTGGASAVYGSDAMAGVINFILDTDFEGFSLTTGVSGYWHNNNSSQEMGAGGTIRDLMDTAGFSYPSGDRGIDGKAYNVDVAIGSGFDGGRGHAMAYFTYRKNDELRQGARDYSSCALNDPGTACGGSGTSVNPTFTHGYLLVDGGGNPIINHAQNDETGEWEAVGQVSETIAAHLNPDSSWAAGGATPYNFAPINHYQRPDERWTFGNSVKYEVSPQFRPYVETMFANSNTSVQIAESGTFFFNQLGLDCGSPLLGNFCSGYTEAFGEIGEITYFDADGNEVTTEGFIDLNGPITTSVGKRNVEGGPRIAQIESNSFRVVTGAEGDIAPGWAYNASFLYGRNSSVEANVNDFIGTAVGQALLACDDGGVLNPNAPGCYNVWQFGGVTPEAASTLAGDGIRKGATSLMVINGYVAGDTGVTSPWAEESVSLVAGMEWRKEMFSVTSDANMQTGNFTGLGGPRPSINGDYSVTEFFAEAGVPILQDMGYLQSLALDLGYRYSNYSTSGGVHTYKAGATAQIGDYVRLRGGYNRAIRAPNVVELFSDQQIALTSSLVDHCAGETPAFTLAQCQNTGVSSAQYGSILANPASQYNQFIGGNPDLNPEKATTYTVGFIATPMPGLQVSVDYFNISIEDKIGTIGAGTVFDFCATTGDPFLCSKINRNAASGDLWVGSNLATSGFVENLNDNFGNLKVRGVDFSSNYAMDLGDGRLSASFIGTLNLEQQNEPLPGINDDAIFDCSGVINPICMDVLQDIRSQPTFRHTVRVSYAQDWLTASVRWRRIGGLDYVGTDGSPLNTDQILANVFDGRLPAWNYLDLTLGFDVHENASLIFGVNNVLDKNPPITGPTVAVNANSPGGYDQLGRYVHASLNLRF